jgi:hypothetical protein
MVASATAITARPIPSRGDAAKDVVLTAAAWANLRRSVRDGAEVASARGRPVQDSDSKIRTSRAIYDINQVP